MALTTQDPQLQLVGGRLGSQARLQAGADQILSRAENIATVRVALFHGARPSPLEIDTGTFVFEGDTPAGNIVGLWEFNKTDFVQLAAEPALMRDPSQPQNSVQNGQALPASEADMIPTDELDYFHAVFRRNAVKNNWGTNYYNTDISAEGRALGNGYAPTWGLVSLFGGSGSWSGALESSTSSYCDVQNTTGQKQRVCVHSMRWPYVHYITVGDWRDEPTANLTLYRGAEADRSSQPSQISPQRLRMRLNPMVPVVMGA